MGGWVGFWSRVCCLINVFLWLAKYSRRAHMLYPQARLVQLKSIWWFRDGNLCLSATRVSQRSIQIQNTVTLTVIKWATWYPSTRQRPTTFPVWVAIGWMLFYCNADLKETEDFEAFVFSCFMVWQYCKTTGSLWVRMMEPCECSLKDKQNWKTEWREGGREGKGRKGRRKGRAVRKHTLQVCLRLDVLRSGSCFDRNEIEMHKDPHEPHMKVLD